MNTATARRERGPSIHRTACLASVALAVALLVGWVSERATAAPVWNLVSTSNTTAQPGREFTFFVDVINRGDASTDGTDYTLTATLPPGMTGVGGSGFDGCPGAFGATVISCTSNGIASPNTVQPLALTVSVAPGAALRTARFEISGGGVPLPGRTVDPVIVSVLPSGFGIDAFDVQVTANPSGGAFTQAAGHPYAASATIDFNTSTDPSPLVGGPQPIEPVKDVIVDTPPGFVGDPTGMAQCTNTELSHTIVIESRPLCAPASQVGTAVVSINGQGAGNIIGPIPVFNLVPPPDVPARFGLNALGTVVVFDAAVRSGTDYGLTVSSKNISEGLSVLGTSLTLWGVPSDPIHDLERGCPGEVPPASGGPTCRSSARRQAFLRNPTSCTVPGVGLPATLRTDSWFHPGDFKEAVTFSHLPPSYPEAPESRGPQQGPDGCAKVPFDVRLSGKPVEGAKAGAPTAFSFDVTLPQTDDPEVIGQADLKKAVVTLPEGVRVSPGSAEGLAACSSAQIALRSGADPTCPAGSKLGSVTIDTPLLEEQVTGGIYLATPFDNPFNSLVAIYLVARARGVVLKLFGRASMDPMTGQITTTFDDNPQLPFSRLHLEFKGGPRSPLTTPKRCGTYTTHAVLTSWSGKTVVSDSDFTLTEDARGQPCPSTFTPDFSVGTESNTNGDPSSFVLRLTRDDEDQELKGVTVEMPDGLTGLTGNVPLCGETDAKAGTCPDASRVGTVTVGAGAGSNPFFITNGRVYLTGPYKGGPFGLSIVVPAVAGPFDLGTVTVRQAIYVDRHKATLRIVSDPLPTILEGIPLDVRDVRVNIDRKNFIINPTSCAEKQIGATLESVQGSIAHVSARFQAADCGSRSVGLRMPLDAGKLGRTGRGASIPLSTTIRLGAASTHLRFVRVTLPTTINARLPVINRACTRDAFENARCEGARAGTVVVNTPLLRDPLRGNVFFVKNGNPLPDLFIALRGQVAVDLIGRVSIPGGKRLRTTFDAIPDVPFTSFKLQLVAGRQGPVGAATNLCSRRGRNAKAELDFIGQNGKVLQLDQRMRIHGCAGHRAVRARRAARKRGGRQGRR